MTAAETTVLDVREVAPRDRHARIFAELSALAAGGILDLRVDHDPRPLWYQLQAEQPDRFTWSYLEQGPDLWRVRIERNGDDGAPPEPLSLDNRGLEPPEPLVRILEALTRLSPGQCLLAQTDREPLLLYPQLASRGFSQQTTAQADGGFLVRIWKDA
jgi:uncharacterized protein (DUF2249 family)